jgi:Carboxypeptidase regulatory-like domain/TonB-dependent Receptor Plug Domain
VLQVSLIDFILEVSRMPNSISNVPCQPAHPCRSLITAVLALIILVIPSIAQETTGTILGAVTDTTGAVLPNAKVTITNVDRHAIERTLNTSHTGEYDAPQLSIGKYSITVEAPGFKRSTEAGIVLNVNDKLSVNIALQVGNVAETVSVQANALQVDTQSAAATGLITGTQVRELALQSRNFEQLVALMPGVTSDIGDFLYAGVSSPSGATNETAFSLNGSFGTQNNWTVDGADNVDRGGNFSLLNYPSVDAIDEFKVLRGNYNAEYGRSAGGQINVITRSGKSKFHGGLYEFFRNDVLDANTWSNKQTSPAVPRTPLRYNDFGGVIGGPVFIPGRFNADRSKTFFFFSEEARRVVESSSGPSQVPNLQERGLDSTTGNQPTFAYPVCLVPLASDANGNSTCPGPSSTTIPVSQINPAAAAYLKDVYSHVPVPQDPVGDILIANQSNVFNYRQEIYRVDHTFNNKWSGFARIMTDTIPTIEGGGLFNGNSVPNITRTSTQSPGKSIVASINTTFTPTVLNQLEYAWSFGAVLSTNIGELAATNSPDVASAIQLPFPETLNRIPSISFGSSQASFFGFGSYKDYNKNHNVFDNVTWIVGRHSLKFGASYFHYQKSENSGGNNAGTFTYQVTPDPTLSGGDYTNGPVDPQAEWHQEFAYFLLGQSTNFAQLQQDIRAIIDQNQFEAYAQDEFRIRPNFTASYGVRYSLFRQPTDAKGHATSFDPSRYDPTKAPVLDDQGNLCTPETQPCSGTSTTNPNYDPLNGVIIGGTTSPFGTAVSSQSTLGFAPRIGFVWDPQANGKMSVRAGYGVFIDAPAVGYVENNVFANPPFVGTATIFGAPFDNPAAGQAAPNSSPTPLGGTEVKFHQPYTQQWDLDIQRELPKNIIADVGYYASKGTHLLAPLDVNQPTPGAYAAVYGPGTINSGNENLINPLRPFIGYAGIDLYEPIFSSNYHSLQASLQKRFTADSLITINYTWSKSLTNLPFDPNFTVVHDSHDLASEYAPSRFDQRHVFNADFVYQLPFLREQHGLAGHTLGGWEVSGIVSVNSGHYLDPTISDGSDPGGIGLNTGVDGNVVRPDQVANPNSGAPHKAGEWFSTAAFAPAPASQTVPGNARKNSILGPGRQNWDLTMMKNLKVHEESSFQLRIETFNTFNHTSFDSVDTDTNSGTYGQVTSAHQPRILQLALKYTF